MGVARLCELPVEWSRQYRMLGPDRAVTARIRTEPCVEMPAPVRFHNTKC